MSGESGFGVVEFRGLRVGGQDPFSWSHLCHELCSSFGSNDLQKSVVIMVNIGCVDPNLCIVFTTTFCGHGSGIHASESVVRHQAWDASGSWRLLQLRGRARHRGL